MLPKESLLQEWLLELAKHDGASLLNMLNDIVENFKVAAIVNVENMRNEQARY